MNVLVPVFVIGTTSESKFPLGDVTRTSSLVASAEPSVSVTVIVPSPTIFVISRVS